MAKYAAVRNMNFCNNVVRVGTFNMYNPRGTTGWQMAKKMFADFALDVVGFQEVSASQERVLSAYLDGWQFTDGHTFAPVAIASHFPVISYQEYTNSVTDRPYLNCKINLPRYGDVWEPVLSMYTYHGVVSSQESRLQEIAEMLTVISQDTSDFIVVVGDTNSFDSAHPEWQAFQNAGLTPAHNDGGMVTVIDNDECLDNIFMSAHITCENVHVVPARDYMIQQNENLVPLSDHDFVFADLKFDFTTVLAEKTAQS